MLLSLYIFLFFYDPGLPLCAPVYFTYGKVCITHPAEGFLFHRTQFPVKGEKQISISGGRHSLSDMVSGKNAGASLNPVMVHTFAYVKRDSKAASPLNPPPSCTLRTPFTSCLTSLLTRYVSAPRRSFYSATSAYTQSIFTEQK